MRWLNWKTLTASAVALVAGVGYAAGNGEKLPAPAYVADLLADLPAAAGKLQPHSPAREAIESGDLEAARAMLSFRPLNEAPLPEGFPAYTPVGVIEVKQYPAYRKAVGPGFWPLFQHISKQDIPMTAPVEMRSSPGQQGEGPMAFLYQSTAVGAPGPIDGVAVEDAAPTVVASLGLTGRMNREAAVEARERLEAWLAGQSEHRLAATPEPFRLFGYNSPMVPKEQQYWEAQLLLEPAPKP